jgi:hypothetical protein
VDTVSLRSFKPPEATRLRGILSCTIAQDLIDCLEYGWHDRRIGSFDYKGIQSELDGIESIETPK